VLHRKMVAVFSTKAINAVCEKISEYVNIKCGGIKVSTEFHRVKIILYYSDEIKRHLLYLRCILFSLYNIVPLVFL